jgi:tetratricopeptide (TPR) repeat protein
VFVQLDFRIDGKPAKAPNSTVFFDDSGVIQIVANPPEALCKSALNSEYEARACYGRGTMLSAAEKYDEAINCLTRALLWVPDVDIYIERGIAYRKSGHLAEAIADYTEAIRLAPSNADAYFDRGNARLDAGAFDLAIEDYSKALGLNPRLVQAYGNRANAYLNEHRFALALDDFSAILRNNPQEIKAQSHTFRLAWFCRASRMLIAFWIYNQDLPWPYQIGQLPIRYRDDTRRRSKICRQLSKLIHHTSALTLAWLESTSTNRTSNLRNRN